MKSSILQLLILILILGQSCNLIEAESNPKISRNAIVSSAQTEKTDSLETDSAKVKITLTWSEKSDLDLYVQDPMGEWIWHKHQKSQSKGRLNKDVQDGTEAEIIEWPLNDFPLGEYKVFVKHSEGDATNFHVEVCAFGNTKNFSGSIEKKQQLNLTSFSQKEWPTNILNENFVLPQLRKTE